MPPSVTNPTELRLFSTSSPVMSPRNPPTPAPPGPAPGVEAVMSSALTPFIVTAVANGGLAANVLLEVTSTSLVAPVAAPVVCRLSPVFRVLLPSPNGVTNGSALKTVSGRGRREASRDLGRSIGIHRETRGRGVDALRKENTIGKLVELALQQGVRRQGAKGHTGLVLPRGDVDQRICDQSFDGVGAKLNWCLAKGGRDNGVQVG